MKEVVKRLLYYLLSEACRNLFRLEFPSELWMRHGRMSGTKMVLRNCESKKYKRRTGRKAYKIKRK